MPMWPVSTIKLADAQFDLFGALGRNSLDSGYGLGAKPFHTPGM
jgi:hypothetical protein